MNGAAAHLIDEGDEIDVLAFTWSAGEIKPLFIEVDEKNRFLRYSEGFDR